MQYHISSIFSSHIGYNKQKDAKKGKLKMAAYTVNSDVLTVQLKGEIDHHTAGRMAKEADELIARYEPTLLVLDFGNVTFSDSSGIAVVLGRYKKMKELGGQTELSSVPKAVKRIFTLAAVDKLVKIRENV